MIARVLHTKRASQGSQAWHSVQSTSGLSKIRSPTIQINAFHDVLGTGFSYTIIFLQAGTVTAHIRLVPAIVDVKYLYR